VTEAENKVRQAELDVQTAESKEREARRVMETGYEKLRAELEAGYARLKEEHQRTLVAVEKEKAYLARALAEAEENGGFVKN
jgi:uncharacterized protein YfbU (UPF0304 family)